ncbi:MAG: MAPEG family protein [Burkholderiaceae bacterium]
MQNTLIFYPLCAMALLILIVTVFMLRERVGEFKSRRIHPQKLPSSSQMQGVLENTRAADNYKNLFEMPVLFYLLCVLLHLTQQVSVGMLVAAWLYVVLRCIHSFIHIGYNKVMDRFKVFLASAALLFGMWIAFFIQLMTKA